MKTESSDALPYVVVNMAMTADGKIATANRAACSFGSERDKRRLFELRATADAVMAGARTVDAGCVDLGPGPARYRRIRLKRGLAPCNLRVIVSRLGSIDPNAEVFKKRFSPIIVLTTREAGAKRLRRLGGLADEVKICGATHVNLVESLKWLRVEWGVRRLVCEGGGDLNDAMVRAGLVDELHLTICPLVLGGRGAPGIAEGAGVGALAKATMLDLASAHRQCDEMYLVFKLRKS